MTEPRIHVTKKVDLNDYAQCPIEDLIARFQELSMQAAPGASRVDFGWLEVTYESLETDAEYQARVAMLADAKEHRRALYEQLKAEFDEAGL